MGEYIDVPKNLDRRALESLFGYEAVTFYLNRIAQRQREGMVYKNPYKTVFLWATRDKKRTMAFTHRTGDIPEEKNTKTTAVRDTSG